MFSTRDIRASRGVQAFTLLEVIVAMAIVSMGVVGILGAFSLSNRAASQCSRLEKATAIAQKELEVVTTVPVDQLESASGASGQHEWTMTLSNKPYGLVMASVIVKWRDRGEVMSYQVSRVFLPRGRSASQ